MPRTSLQVRVGNVLIGGGAPIAVQSMTNTDTADVEATAAQITGLAATGAELVRVTVNNEAAARAVPLIRAQLQRRGCRVPLIGDFHFNGHILLRDFPECAAALDKYRINPGNVGCGERHDPNFAAMIACAVEYQKPIRIGVNWGSVDQDLLTCLMNKNARAAQPKTDREVLLEALVESAIASAARAEELGLPADRIIVSVKTSEVTAVIHAYEMLAGRCRYALHLGLTEAGSGVQGLVASAAALGVLLQKGIGDTIRISLTPSANEPRVREVEACKALLQSLELRQFSPRITSCPGCGRTENADFQRLTEEVNAYVARKMPEWTRARPEVKKLKIAVMGCVVNGPGEARQADIALCLPGRTEEPIGSVFVRGKLVKTLRGGNLAPQFLTMLEELIASYGNTL